jgi:uncharacterized membrane protein affecting hemolysin expression
MIRRELEASVVYKCYVTFKNGVRKFVRINYDMVARMTAAFRNFQKCIYEETWLLPVSGFILNVSEVKSMRFVNESTGLELLTVE